jgi:hypothetical protein
MNKMSIDMQSMRKNILKHNIETLDIFRPVQINDIKIGAVLYGWQDDAKIYKHTVDSFINATIFLADDGSAYDIFGDFYVLKSNTDMQNEIERLKTMLINIQEYVKAVEI